MATQHRETVGVLGAGSVTGPLLLREIRLRGLAALAMPDGEASLTPAPGLVVGDPEGMPAQPVPLWISALELDRLPAHFALLERFGARRVVAISSMDVLTKSFSADPDDLKRAESLKSAEGEFRFWAKAHDVAWTVLRPTLVYGQGRDRTVAEIARLIRRLGFFPVLGPAEGLRQPLHGLDLARAACAALRSPLAENRIYAISGAEVLTYSEMVTRIFQAMGRPVRLRRLPLFAFHLAAAFAAVHPRYRHYKIATVIAMNQDMAFSHQQAARDFGFTPRRFDLRADDLPH